LVRTLDQISKEGMYLSMSRCARCDNIDTLEHRLINCPGTEEFRQLLTEISAKLYKTTTPQQIDPTNRIMVAHKDCSAAALTLHAEILNKIVLSTSELPDDPRYMIRGMIISLIKRETRSEVITDLQLLINETD